MVAGKVAPVIVVELVFAVVGIPFAFHALHLGLQLPEARRLRTLVDPYHEVHREHRLRIVAEGAEQAETFYLGVADASHAAAHLVGQSVADVHEDVALALGERVSLSRGAKRGRHLALHAIFLQPDAIITRAGRLLVVGGAVVAVVDVELARGGHGEQRAHLWAAHAAQHDMGEAGHVDIVVFVGCRPPSLVLVKLVEVRAHHVERGHRHQSVRQNRSRVADREVCRANHWVDISCQVTRFGVLREARQGEKHG